MIRYLSDPENKQSFNIYVKGGYKDLFGGDDVDGIVVPFVPNDLSLDTGKFQSI